MGICVKNSPLLSRDSGRMVSRLQRSSVQWALFCCLITSGPAWGQVPQDGNPGKDEVAGAKDVPALIADLGATPVVLSAGRLGAHDRAPLPPVARSVPVGSCTSRSEIVTGVRGANGRSRHRHAPGGWSAADETAFLGAVADRVEHRFEDFTDDLAVWVVFYGPEGGEAS
jgi:hypothetical protein